MTPGVTNEGMVMSLLLYMYMYLLYIETPPPAQKETILQLVSYNTCTIIMFVIHVHQFTHNAVILLDT